MFKGSQQFSNFNNQPPSVKLVVADLLQISDA